MNAPLFKQLSREELNKLNAEEQLAYMAKLMEELRAQSRESRQQLEEAKRLIADLEKRYPAPG